jgi:hypothetical protein
MKSVHRLLAGACVSALVSCGQGSSDGLQAPVPTLITVAPPVLAMSVGEEEALAATVFDQDGAVIPNQLVSWESDASTVVSVTTQGVVQALSPGATEITASSGAVSAVVPVDVEVGQTPTLIDECQTPAGEWIWCDDFDQDRSSAYFEFPNPGGSFARIVGVGVEGSPAMRARFQQGQVDAGALHLAFGRTPTSYVDPVDAGTQDYREVYWRFFLRNQSGWTGGGGEKLSRVMSLVTSNWSQAMIAHVWSAQAGPEYNFLTIDPASGTDAAGTLQTSTYNDFANLRWLGAVRGTSAIFTGSNIGTWHCIEAHVKLNDAGSSNGSFELWIDGVLDAQKTGMNWVGAFDDYGINALFLENYWNLGSPAAQDRYFDNLVVSTSRIGCGN